MNSHEPAMPMAAAATARRPRSLVWWIAAAVVLAAGYADLWRGGDTIAPILMALGYCVLVPIAILR